MLLYKHIKPFLPFIKQSLKFSFSILAEEGSIVDYKDEIVYFKNFQEKKLKYRSLLKTPDQNHVFLLSLNEKVSCGPLLKKFQGNVVENLLNKKLEIVANDELELPFKFTEEIYGKIVDFRGNQLEEKVEKENNKKEKFSKVYKIQEIFEKEAHVKKRTGTDGQIWTGNLAIDYSNPIAKGNFVIFKGDHATGKSHVASNLIKNFVDMEESPIYNTKFKQTKAVYVTLNVTSAQKMKKTLDSSTKNQNFVIFSPAPNASVLEKFLLPFSAIKFAKYLENTNNDVLFVLDDGFEHFFKEHHLFNSMNQPFSPLSMCNEMSSVAGCFPQGSFTSVLILDESEPQPILYKAYEAFKNNAESLADVIVEFDLKDEVYRHVKPKIDFVINRNMNIWQGKLIANLKEELRLVMEKLKDDKRSLEGKKELKIHIDPWEAYFFLDSTYFMRLLISKKFYTPIESLILMKFTLKAIQEDVVSLFKDEPEVLVEKLFAFSKKYQEFEGKDIISFLKEKMIHDLNDPNLSNFVIECINRLFELFLTSLKMSDSLLPFKKDYFK